MAVAVTIVDPREIKRERENTEAKFSFTEYNMEHRFE